MDDKKKYRDRQKKSIIAVAIILLLAAATFLSGKITQNHQAPGPPAAQKQLSSSEHMINAEQAMEGYKEGGKGPWGDIHAAKTHLEAISASSPEFKRAKTLLQEVYRREGEKDKVAEEIAQKMIRDQRQRLAKNIENAFLDGGKDAYVTTSGKEDDILTIRYVLISRPWVHAFSKNESQLLTALSRAGFKKLILTDGHRDSWTINLAQ